MNILKSKNIIKSRTLTILSLVLGIGVVFCGMSGNANAETMTATSSWGPTRDVYEWAPDGEDGGADHVVFNSMVDNQSGGDGVSGGVGEEVNFVRVCELSGDTGSACVEQENGDKYVDTLNVVAGKKYQVWVYYHNNANAKYNASATYGSSGFARNARLSMSIPEAIDKGSDAVIKGTITGYGNDTGEGKMDIQVNGVSTGENSVWDTARLHAEDKSIWLRYETGSATIHNGANITASADGKKYDPTSKQLISDGESLDGEALFSDKGVLLSYFSYTTQYAGIIPGCNEYAGYVTFTLVADAPGFYIEKTAKVGEDGKYDSTITVEPGDEIDFQIHYSNTGTTNQEDVTVKDETTGKGLSYKADSAWLHAYDAEGEALTEALQLPNTWFEKGADMGDYKSGQEAYLDYKMTVANDETLFPCGKTTTILNTVAVATENGTMRDSVKINVKGYECSPDEMPRTGADGGEMVMMMLTTIFGMGAIVYTAFGFNMMHRKNKAMASTAQMENQMSQQDSKQGQIKQ